MCPRVVGVVAHVSRIAKSEGGIVIITLVQGK